MVMCSNRDEARREVLSRDPTFLKRAKENAMNHATYVCPACQNGAGPDGTGIVLIPRTVAKNHYRWKCFKCGLNADNVELWKIQTGGGNDLETFDALYNYYGVTFPGSVDNPAGHAKAVNWGTESRTEQQNAAPGSSSFTRPNAEAPAEDEGPDYTDYFESCARELKASDYAYPNSRLLTDDICARFNFGLDTHFGEHFPKITGGRCFSAFIIPTGPRSFVARNTDPKCDPRNRYRKVGGVELFNRDALKKKGSPLWVVEGEIDAATLEQYGARALGLGTTSNVMRAFGAIQGAQLTDPVIVSLDSDEAGQKAAAELVQKLTLNGIDVYQAPADIWGKYKDPNGVLIFGDDLKTEGVNVGDTLKAVILAGEDAAIAHANRHEVEAEEQRKRDREDYFKEQSGYKSEYDAEIKECEPRTPTGFPTLSEQLDDGIRSGLYIVGAISSLGKTTMVMQMADHFASQKRDVLVFSLEMARNELIAKSVSRCTAEVIQNHEVPVSLQMHPMTAFQVSEGYRFSSYSDDMLDLIRKAEERYFNYTRGHLWIFEGHGDVGIPQIRDAVKKHIALTGHHPVVIIDYIQIMAPHDPKLSDKQNTDFNVSALKILSRDKETRCPVIGISSFNRASYDEAVSMEAFKESGAIEYSADVLIGLQLEGAGTADFDVDAAKRGVDGARHVEAVILKNRGGRTGNKVKFRYFPAQNQFFDDGLAVEQKRKTAAERKAEREERASAKEKELIKAMSTANAQMMKHVLQAAGITEAGGPFVNAENDEDAAETLNKGPHNNE